MTVNVTTDELVSEPDVPVTVIEYVWGAGPDFPPQPTAAMTPSEAQKTSPSTKPLRNRRRGRKMNPATASTGSPNGARDEPFRSIAKVDDV